MLKEIYHYILIKTSGLFNRKFYLENYQDVQQAKINPIFHYLKFGWKEGRNPSSKFDNNFYLDKNPDVYKKGINPLIHYIKHGKKESREIRSSPIRKYVEGEDLPNDKSNNKISKTIQENREIKTKSAPIIYNKKKSGKLTLYLHIGQNKTGTSAIQLFLDANRQLLFSEFGYIYPDFSSKNLISGHCANHVRWYQTVSNDFNDLSSDIAMLVNFSTKKNVRSIILSSEALFLDDNVVMNFKKLLETKLPIKIKTICYLRRIDQWVESAWKQWGLKEYDSFDEFASQPKYMSLYQHALNHLTLWENVIGKENVIVRPYERQQLQHGLINDFLNTIGIDFQGFQWEEVENDNQVNNSGFNRDVLEILHICRELFSDVHDNHLFELFTNLLGEQFQKKPFEPYTLLSPQKRYELINHNSPYEQKISERFMNRTDGKIFYDPIPDPNQPWEPYKGLTLEIALPILIKMIDENNKKLKEIHLMMERE